ncbi:hypothetical protein ADIARSV_3336 [Arcticibacter svalbardensis MN12-7]|uniref:DUF6850 domain-containing protein n=1 Tax=Arcticibacter svalbardensis MN12-7 TaxID=1150600 RepID=R9GNR7_9SPHI|nr:DUF6850 family outer membrane beta-barrel protein [Arcticibacter svalbardensis]EOR93487.1 hypothetical protein ADIARSV_3336 [Arcticibacter svalbardensis MN12-7]
MNKLTAYLIIAVLSVPCFAVGQNRDDSIYFFKQSRERLTFAKYSATLLNGSGIDSSGKASIGLSYEKGPFKQAQQAYSTFTTRFYTEGIRKLGRFKVAGSFNFDKVWDDSLSWTLRGTNFMEEPYYFFAAKAGKYERQDYNLNGVISYDVLKDKVYLSLGAEHNYHLSTRSVDPRPEISNFLFVIKPEITVRLKNQLIGFGVDWGYGNETIGIGYKNQNFRFNTLYEDRVTYLSYGYGKFRTGSGLINARYREYSGLNLSYLLSLKEFELKANIARVFWLDNNVASFNDYKNNNIFSKFRLDTYKADVLVSKNNADRNQQLIINVLSSRGDDWLSEFYANNYLYRGSSLGFSYTYLKKEKELSPEFGINVLYNNTYKRDAGESTVADYTSLHTGLSLGFYKQLKNKEHLSFEVAPSAIFPLKSDLSVPRKEGTRFTRGVIYPDYYFQNTKAGQLKGNIEYLSRNMIKQFNTGIKLQATYLRSLESISPTYPVYSIPGKSRTLIDLNFNLYF